MSVKIDQAFIDAFIDGDFGLSIAHENTDFQPTAGTEYVELINIPNNVTALTLNGDSETDGIFRVIMRYPSNTGSVNAKLKADEILSVFSIGADVCYSGQCAIIRTTSRAVGTSEDGWYKIILTISYYAEIN